jgi:hypothetical protein
VPMVSKGVTAHTRFVACLEWRGDVVAGHRSSRCSSNGGQKDQLSGALGEERREERDPREKKGLAVKVLWRGAREHGGSRWQRCCNGGGARARRRARE